MNLHEMIEEKLSVTNLDNNYKKKTGKHKVY